MTRDRANTFLYYLMGGVGGLIALVVANGFAHLVGANAVRDANATALSSQAIKPVPVLPLRASIAFRKGEK